MKGKDWISWMHEREWRVEGNFRVPTNASGVLVKKLSEVKKLADMIEDEPDEFNIIPQCILPIETICQGLVY